jgi:exodeoxyribonuclease V alpha subunit
VFDHSLYNSEKHIAEKLTQLARLCPRMDNRDIRLLLEKCESACGIEFATSQIRALTAAMSNGVMILTGGPGTGKTTIVKGLISIFDSLDMKVSLAAPTGRAAKRMSEATSTEAKTIHRLLEVDFSDESGKRFLRDEDNTIDSDVLIVDEASMIDVELMCSLLRAMKNGSRLILIGDTDQLPSVGAGNVLGDIIASEKFTVIRLTEIFRQSEKSLIIKNAHRINEGLLPDTSDKRGDFFFLPRESEEAISATVIDLVRNRLPRTYGEDIIRKIQVITPSKKGLSGTDTLNEGLQAALNPPSPKKAERHRGAVIFREGDRVMQTKNNYQIEWETDDGRSGMGIYNGDIGDIVSVDHEENTVTVRFDERECTLDSAQLDEIEHAYAITVHKSQGSEYPVVIIPLYSCAPMLMSRNLLYTAVTRGAKMVILVGRGAVLERMVESEHHAQRCTMLKEFLADA